jgi:hypothetical protein
VTRFVAARGEQLLSSGVNDLASGTVNVAKDGAHLLSSGAVDFASAMKGAAKAVENMSPSEIGHTVLNGVAMIPGFGAPADAINAGWYTTQRDWGNAALSAATAIRAWAISWVGRDWILRQNFFIDDDEVPAAAWRQQTHRARLIEARPRKQLEVAKAGNDGVGVSSSPGKRPPALAKTIPGDRDAAGSGVRVANRPKPSLCRLVIGCRIPASPARLAPGVGD